MTGLEIWLVAISLAMDCFAVSVASGIILKRPRWRAMFVMALAFGFFQALMPLIGWWGASLFSHLIESVDHWIAFAILAFLGGRMVRESLKADDCKHTYDPTNLKVVLAFAAVGIHPYFLPPVMVCALLWSVDRVRLKGGMPGAVLQFHRVHPRCVGVFAGAFCTEVLGKWADGGNLGSGFAVLAAVIAVALLIQLSVLRPKTDNME